jgi:hypothetical protein
VRFRSPWSTKSATGALAATAIRSEATLREDDAVEATVRATLGLDRLFTPGRNDLYLIAELQYDRLGARDALFIP